MWAQSLQEQIGEQHVQQWHGLWTAWLQHNEKLTRALMTKLSRIGSCTWKATDAAYALVKWADTLTGGITLANWQHKQMHKETQGENLWMETGCPFILSTTATNNCVEELKDLMEKKLKLF